MKIEEFWRIYDIYVATGNYIYLPDLSEGLAEHEAKDRLTQLLRPEKGWYNILAWQVTRNQVFQSTPDHRFHLSKHEIIMWDKAMDRDIYISRIPSLETVAGTYFNPGNKFGLEDKDNYSETEWDRMIRTRTFTDERGLYLPLYTKRDVLFLLKAFMQEYSEEAVMKAAASFGY